MLVETASTSRIKFTRALIFLQNTSWHQRTGLIMLGSSSVHAGNHSFTTTRCRVQLGPSSPVCHSALAVLCSKLISMHLTGCTRSMMHPTRCHRPTCGWKCVVLGPNSLSDEQLGAVGHLPLQQLACSHHSSSLSSFHSVIAMSH